jgi:hypothetical protein
MKKIILTSLLLILGSCAHTKVVQYNNASIKICAPRLMGCAPRIAIGDKSYLVDPVTDEARSKYQELDERLRKQNKFEISPVQVSGYTTKELGHFPNPMAEFEVFKLSDLNLPEAK